MAKKKTNNIMFEDVLFDSQGFARKRWREGKIVKGKLIRGKWIDGIPYGWETVSGKTTRRGTVHKKNLKKVM